MKLNVKREDFVALRVRGEERSFIVNWTKHKNFFQVMGGLEDDDDEEEDDGDCGDPNKTFDKYFNANGASKAAAASAVAKAYQ